LSVTTFEVDSLVVQDERQRLNGCGRSTHNFKSQKHLIFFVILSQISCKIQQDNVNLKITLNLQFLPKTLTWPAMGKQYTDTALRWLCMTSTWSTQFTNMYCRPGY